MSRSFYVWVILGLALSCPLAGAATYHTINVDGNTNDFDDSCELIWEDSQSDCFWDFNELYKMYVTWDANKLYFGANFLIETANSLSCYMDFGLGEGAIDLGTVGWFKFFYAEGWLANFSANISGNGTHGLYRVYADYTDDDWTNNSSIVKAADLTGGMYELAVPWSTIYPGGMPAHASMKVVATLTGFRGYDGADAMPDQTDPTDGDGEYDVLDIPAIVYFDIDGDGVPDPDACPNQPPTSDPPVCDVSAEPTSGTAPLTVQFTGTAFDPDGGAIVSYLWNFGDGTSSDLQNPTHEYQAGSYTASMTVADDEGQTCVDTIVITATGSGDTITLDLTLSEEQPSCYGPGDQFLLMAQFINPGVAASHDFYCVLDVYGSYFFHPVWGQDLGYETITVPAASSSKSILQFVWPEGAGSANNILFYAALMAPGSFNLTSNLDIVTLCFEE